MQHTEHNTKHLIQTRTLPQKKTQYSTHTIHEHAIHTQTQHKTTIQTDTRNKTTQHEYKPQLVFLKQTNTTLCFKEKRNTIQSAKHNTTNHNTKHTKHNTNKHHTKNKQYPTNTIT